MKYSNEVTLVTIPTTLESGWYNSDKDQFEVYQSEDNGVTWILLRVTKGPFRA